MTFLTGFLTVLFIINCALLVLIILPQNEGGSNGMFAPSTTQFGSRSGNIMTRSTTVLGISFFILSLLLAYANRSGDFSDDEVIKASRDLNGQTVYKWWEEDNKDDTNTTNIKTKLDNIDTTKSKTLESKNTDSKPADEKSKK